MTNAIKLFPLVVFALLYAWPGTLLAEEDLLVDQAPYHVVGAEQAKVATLGSRIKGGEYKLEVDLSGWGASVLRVRLADYREKPIGGVAYEIQTSKVPGHNGEVSYVYPYAAKSVTIDGQAVDLSRVKWELVEPSVYRTSFDGDEQPSQEDEGDGESTTPDDRSDVLLFDKAVYRAVVLDVDGQKVLEIKRVYELKKDSYDLRCRVEIKNLTDREVELVWDQLAQGDTPLGIASYLGDQRLVVGGYRDLDYNPSGQYIYTDKAYMVRQDIVNGESFWPNEDLPQKRELVWVASLNRYFAVVTHPLWETGAASDAESSFSGTEGRAGIEKTFERLGVEVIGRLGSGKDDNRRMFFRMTTRPIQLGAGEVKRFEHGIFAGPRRQEVFEQEPYESLSFAKLIKYELGCTFCTFQPLAHGLLWFLKTIHAVVRDWGVSIIILVLFVRLLLHPITKRAQINMMKMGKQMQSMQPELEKLKQKYKDDKQKFQQEQVKLWREKGVNPVNMLGCLPMFLQTPIWIALYAMLYFAIELRHEQAFYGLFQTISGGTWGFLGDLSSPDSFIKFAGEGFTLPLGFINPTFSGINLLPILMGGVFYVQQKLTSPPAASEQAAQQQKIMQIMMIFMFPVMLYSAPSGLTLYILASTFAGIVDSYIVRRHIKKEEEAGTLFDKKPPKEGGFMDRIQKAVAQKQEQLMAQQQSQSKRGGSGGGAKRKGGRRKGR